MGITYADIEIVRGDDLALFREGYLQEAQIRKVSVSAMVDSGASMLVITNSIRNELDLRKVDEQQAELAEGTIVLLDLVGPVEIRFENRRTIAYALALPNDADVLLGAIPMQDLDVLVDPRRERLIVNPRSPDVARKSLK